MRTLKMLELEMAGRALQEEVHVLLIELDGLSVALQGRFIVLVDEERVGLRVELGGTLGSHAGDARGKHGE